jgi:Spy/CpxP family protein refolding chaperone
MKAGWVIAAWIIASAGHASTHPHVSPYADQAASDIKALTADEKSSLLEGKGAGFAKAAELNGYPGPLHVLELAEPLELTAEQLANTRSLYERMRDAARAEGSVLVEAERELDRLYATRSASAEKVNAQLARIEAARARLRGVHLNAHLEQAGLLSRHQIARYARLRGYGAHHHSP